MKCYKDRPLVEKTIDNSRSEVPEILSTMKTVTAFTFLVLLEQTEGKSV